MTQINKPLTVARQDYLAAVCDATNQANLPAFVVVEVLDRLLTQMRKAAEQELKRDAAKYRNALLELERAKEAEEAGSDGG